MNVIDTTNAAETAKKVKDGAHLMPAKTLAEALARIYADGARYVQKTGQMQGFAKYSYARETDFIAVLRPLLDLHGVTIRPVKYEVITNAEFERNDKPAYRVVVLATFEFLHSSGDKATAQAIGEGQDSGDKAFNKAMTGAMKYVLRQSFCTETGDDPDDTPSHEQERAAPVTAPVPPKPAPKYAGKDNLPLRARHSQALAQTANKAEVDKVAGDIAFDVKNGTLSEADVNNLRAALEDARKRTK